MLTLALILLYGALAAPYLSEDFESDNWRSTWIESTVESDLQHNGKLGSIETTKGSWASTLNSNALTTMDDEHFYRVGTNFRTNFVPGKGPLIIHYTFKTETLIECGGGFLKFYAPGTDLSQLSSQTPVQMIFGPDFCGTSTRHVLFSLFADGKEYKINQPQRAVNSRHTHTYTLIVYPDGHFKFAQDIFRSFYRQGDLQANFTELFTDHPDYELPSLGAVALDVWQVRAGAMLDDLLITSSERELEDWMQRKWDKDKMFQEEKLVSRILDTEKEDLFRMQQEMRREQQERQKEYEKIRAELKQKEQEREAAREPLPHTEL